MTASKCHAQVCEAAGFTLLELTVVAGLLAGFLLFLTQLLSGGIELFDEGEQGQELSDLSAAAAVGTRGALESLVGPRRDAFVDGPPDTRMLVEWVPLGFASGQEDSGNRVQAIRATVAVPAPVEDELRAAGLRERAVLEGGGSEEEVEARVIELQNQTPHLGRATMLLLPWPAGDPDGAFLELRSALWLPGQEIEVERRRRVPLLQIEELERLPPELVVASTEPIASGLLHVEFEFWSQYTSSWDSSSPDQGPEWVWDSARAGLLSEGEDQRSLFALDLGPSSLDDTTDDVFPRMIRATLVVARQGGEARLAAAIGSADKELQLLTTQPLPDLDETPYLKVGGEWIRHGGASGTLLRGLQRGLRGTAARSHVRGTTVRAGKKVIVLVPILHGRDNWNG